MKLYQFFKNDHITEDAHPLLELVGTKHNYLTTGIVILHSMGLPTEVGLEDIGNPDNELKTLEEEHFIPYHSFGRVEITEVDDE